jgi:DmsE family decaheme c-type cytochrome
VKAKRSWTLLAASAAVGLALGFFPMASAVSAGPDPKTEAKTAGATADSAGGSEMAAAVAVNACADCHEDQVLGFVGNPHAVLDLPGWSAAGGSCVSCHGDGEEHINEGGGEVGIFAFDDSHLPSAKVEVCLTCHGDAHPNFTASAHSAAGLSCTDCHAIHAAPDSSRHLLKMAEAPAAASMGGSFGRPLGEVSSSCAECHGDVLAKFSLNERHRLQEGILDCSSCHNPHEPMAVSTLSAFGQQSCTNCHLDKSGPFVFEHGSVRVEGCTACHSPHGSINRHMLKYQRVAELCFSCHNTVPGFHSRFTLETNCTNCHSSIHGSNFDQFFLK